MGRLSLCERVYLKLPFGTVGAFYRRIPNQVSVGNFPGRPGRPKRDVCAPTQNPNAIANGLSYSVTFQPIPFLGSTIQKSPGSGPSVVGPSVGTRVPVSFGVSYNFRVKKGRCE